MTTLESKNNQRNEFRKDSQLVSWSIPTNPPVPAEKFEVPGKILSNLKVVDFVFLCQIPIDSLFLSKNMDILY